MFDELLARVARELAAARVPYMVIGGQAVLLHGEPRLTRDIDVTLGVDVDRLPSILAVASRAGLEPLVDPEDFTRRTMVLPCRDPRTTARVDLVFSTSAYEKSAIERGVDRVVGGVRVRYASAVDLIIHKVIAGRARDLEDVRSVALKNPGLDREFIRSTLAEFEAELEESFVARFDEVIRSI